MVVVPKINYSKMTSQGMVAVVTFSKPYVDDQAVPENSHQHTIWTKPSEPASSRNNMKCRNLLETCGHVHSYPRVQEREVFLLHQTART